ncbi:Cytochrome P450 1A1 [Mactra antiquata]
MLEFLSITVFFITFLLSCYLFKYFWIEKRGKSPPGPWGLPILGHLPFLGEQPLKTLAKWRNKYGNIFRIRMGSWDTVIVNGYADIKEAAEKPDDDFSCRPHFMTQRVLEEYNGGVSLAFSSFNDAYLVHRKITSTILRYFTGRQDAFTEELMYEEVDVLTSTLLKKTKDGPVDIRGDIQHSVGSIIYQILYGRGEDVKKNLMFMIKFAKDFNEFNRNGNPVDVMPWLEYLMPKRMAIYIGIILEFKKTREPMIKEHIETFSPDKQPMDILDSLLAVDIEHVGNPDITSDRLLGTLADLQGAGFDTTNKTLQFLILHMTKYPDIQRKVQNEIDDVVGNRTHVTLKDKERLVFTEATILESMRMKAVVPLALPRRALQDTQLKGYKISKGTVLFFNLHSALYDEEIWGDPDNFRPSRFLDDNNKIDLKLSSRVISFSLGRRRCVGETLAKMEIFIMFANMMQKCSLMKPEAEVLDEESVPGLVYSPKPFKVIVKERV